MSTKNQRGGAKASPKTERPADALVEPIENVEIEWLMLADWAETINGKLYIQGGGWDRKLVPPKGQPISFGIAAGILVPWHLTNQENRFRLTFETGDGQELSRIEGGFNVGRSVKALPGQKFRTPFSARVGLSVPEEEGAYLARMVVNGTITKEVSFYVVNQL